MYVFFDVHLDKRLSKQSRRRWFETLARSLWRHCNGHLDENTLSSSKRCPGPLTANSYNISTHWGQDEINAILQTTFSNVFLLNENVLISIKISKAQLTTFQHWFRQWLGADWAPSHYLIQLWLFIWRIYASLGISKLTYWDREKWATYPLQWRHNERDDVSNHHPHDCLLNH